MDYNDELIILVSGSIDHKIFVWNPYIDTPVFKINEHNSPITQLRFILDPAHLLSMDIEGVMKVWNLKKMRPIHSF